MEMDLGREQGRRAEEQRRREEERDDERHRVRIALVALVVERSVAHYVYGAQTGSFNPFPFL